jgi:glucokinase
MSNLPGWDDYPLAERLASALGIDCYLENDANAAGWGEFWMGAGRGSSEMVIYTLGTGVGGCVIVRGALHRGSDQNAGELGHALLFPDGRACGCGSRGCLEQYCSASAVARSAREALVRGEETGLPGLAPEEITAEAVHRAAEEGSAFCRGLIETAGRHLGLGIVSVVNILDPQVVVIYGGMAAAGDMLLGPCRRALREHALPPANERVRIVPSELGGDAGVIGAAGLAWRRLDGEEA